MSGDAARDPTEELPRRVVEDGFRRYCVARRERIPDFVDRHFSLRGAAALHRAAFGWDMVRTPVNLTTAAPAAALHLAATGARRLGAPRLASTLTRRRLLLRTSVAHRVEWLICTELLELPCRIGDCIATRDALAETIAADSRVRGALREMLILLGLKGDDTLSWRRLERTLSEYAVTRGAASEIATALLSLAAGAVTLGELTPGAVSLGPTLASIVAQQTAISSFPLGMGLGTLWYGLFPPVPSPLLLFGFSGGLLMVGSLIAAFAGVIIDPLQRRLGLHQRRLRRMIDAMERQMQDPAASDYTVRDGYVARLLDAFDLITAAYRLAR